MSQSLTHFVYFFGERGPDSAQFPVKVLQCFLSGGVGSLQLVQPAVQGSHTLLVLQDLTLRTLQLQSQVTGLPYA